MMTTSDQLGKLGELRQSGLLSEEEFTRAKARVLDGPHCCSPRAHINELRRSKNDRWLGGVCGGLGEYTGIPEGVLKFV